MKKYFFIIGLLFSFFFVNAQEFIYNSDGTKRFFKKQDSSFMISIHEGRENINLLKSLLNNSNSVCSVVTNTKVIFDGSSEVIYDCLKNSDFSFSNLLLSDDSVIHWLTNKLLIKVKQGVAIENLLKTHQIPFSNCKQFGSDKNVFMVTLNDVEDKSITYSNILFESGQVLFAQPDFGMFLKGKNNTNYVNQWGLNNTGQYNGIIGTDINVIPAWSITDGQNVKVAVIDEGVDLNHPDLTSNLLPGFDATDGLLGGTNGGCKGDDAHGTCCSGIIGAEDNSIGIKGVAYNSSVIPIRIAYGNTYPLPYTSWITEVSWIVNGIYQAWSVYDADILSNSWGGSYNDAIANEIRNACKYGRNNKGCVVVVSSGNNNVNNVSFPASLDSVIAVGAISPCGERKNPNSCDGENWGSNYGSKLNVVAPGVLISTTDIHDNKGYNPNLSIHTMNGGNVISSDYQNQDYTIWFNGTSAACPHVSGVAALVLSVNPNLTSQQVKDVIETTARKIRPDIYHYSDTIGHPNGTWNNNVGYGLVDAYAAVQKAMNHHNDLYIRDTVTDDGSMPSCCYSTWDSPDIWVETLDGDYVAHPHGNAWYNVCVRIHNRRDVASSGTERLFLNWSKAGLYDKWNKYWTGDYLMSCGAPFGGVIGRAEGKPIPSIPAHGSIIDTIRWHTPAGEAYECCTDFNYDQWHFCLLARIHDDDEIAHENEQQTDVHALVRDHNNVAQQNVCLDSAENYQKVLGIGNATATVKARLICLSPKVIEGVSITDYAEVCITLDNGLLAALGSSNISGMEWVNGNTLRWTGGSACIPVTLPANSNYTLMTTVRFIADQIPASNNFDFDMVLRNATGDSILGGEHFRCIPPEGCGFDPVVSATPGVDIIDFHVVEEDEYALYEVTDMYGNSATFYTGDFTVFSAESGCYTVCVTTLDGCTECRTLCVTLPDAMLSSIYPNPADGEVNIDYQLSRRISGGTIQIISANGVKMYSQAVTNTTKGKTMKGSLKLSTAAYAPGQYIVRILSSKGEEYDSKTLVVR